jgi:gamma-glutamyltranspeptidase/glutathione hydrolase
VEPALELAERGFAPDPPRRFLYDILAGILLRTEGGARVYGSPEHVVTEELVPTLREVRDEGAAAVARLLPELESDLAAYRVVEHAPLRSEVLGLDVLVTPAPSRGGEIVLEILGALEALEPWTLHGEARAVAVAYERSWPGAPTGTTHISVLDGEGRAAALSSTLGSGSGVFRGGTQLNNMLGELDVIGAAPRAPGERLPSLMTPTLVLDDGRPRLVVGSAGSVRLAGAIAQVTWRTLRGQALEEAIPAPRLHVDGGRLHLEGGWDDGLVTGLPAAWDVVRWEGLNLYFGGVQAVARSADGELTASGDPRRGGAGTVVP